MPDITFSVDEKMISMLDELKEVSSSAGRARVFDIGMTLLKVAYETKRRGGKLMAVLPNGIEKEIILPLQE